MAEGDLHMEQPTSDASTADISHPDTTMTTNTYTNQEEPKSKKSTKTKSKERKKSRASLANIQVLLLDGEEFNYQIDVCWQNLFSFHFGINL